jgi:hypothetical protein
MRYNDLAILPKWLSHFCYSDLIIFATVTVIFEISSDILEVFVSHFSDFT